MSQLAEHAGRETALENLPIVGAQPKSEREEEYLREIRPYEFYNTEEPGLQHKFPYGNTRNRRTFTFNHSQTYDVPRHVARHLEDCTTPIWDWRPDGTGRMVKQKVGEKSRFQMREKFSE